MRIFLYILLLGLFGSTSIHASSAPKIGVDSTTLPKVFILGEYETAYEKLYETHATVLLEVCEDDMDMAFDKWLSMLEEMEAYANSIEYDIKGIKVWLNVFWEKDGSIGHIAYHLKVNSRNVERDELTAFFSSFMNHYKFPIVATSNYSHYGSASFPTFARKIKNEKNPQSTNSKSNSNSEKDSVRSKY